MEQKWRVLVVVSVAAFLASLDLFIVNIAFPSIEADFSGSSVASLSWVLNAYAIVFAALLVPAGRLADRFGHRRFFIAGLALFITASALCGIAPSLGALVAARTLQAIGAAMLVPSSLALLLPEFSPAQRPVAIAIWASVGGVAAAAGPPLGGLLIEASWRLIFLVNLPVGVGALIFAARVLDESVARTERALPDLVGSAVLAASVGALTLGLVQAPSWGWDNPVTLACFAAAAIGVAAFWQRCRTQASPVIDPPMLRVRSFRAANLSALLFFTAFGAMLLASVLYLQIERGDSALVAGLEVAPGPLMAAVFAIPAGRLAATVGQSRLAGFGSILFALGTAWWALRLDPSASYAGAFLPGILATGTGVGFTIASLSSAAAASLPAERFATGSAVLTMARQLGAVLGVALLIAVIGDPAPGADWDRGWALIVAAALLASVSAFAIGDVSPAAQEAADALEGGEAPAPA
jgi:EmrB/QacA subfamily drug resistance transporter